MKALVNLKLPGAFMGESEVLQEVETDRKLRKEEIFTHFIDQTMVMVIIEKKMIMIMIMLLLMWNSLSKLLAR